MQPIVNDNPRDGWYFTTSSANWKMDPRHKSATQIPLSAEFEKVWLLEKQISVNTSMEGEWTAYRHFSTNTEQFTLVFSVNLLLPKFGL